MPWQVVLKESVADDLLWFGKKDAGKLLLEAEQRLSADPGHYESDSPE